MALYTRRFDLTVEPKSHDGVAHGAHMTLRPCLDPLVPGRITERTRATICRPDGTVEIEGQARTQQPSGAVALVDSGRVVENPPLFWVAQTPDRFMTQPASGTDYRHDRGALPLAGLLRSAALSVAKARAQRHRRRASRPVGGRRPRAFPGQYFGQRRWACLLHCKNARLTLLAERALGSILHARGVVATNKVTLTPSRGGETRNRHKLTDAMLADLPLATSTDDGYDWTALLAYIRSGTAGTASRSDLNNLAREFYRIGHDAFNDPENPLNLPPFDALRDYLDTGIIPTAYATALDVPASVLTNSAAYRAAFLANLPQRAYTAALTLTAPDRFEDDPWLVFTAFGGGEYWLATPEGLPIRRRWDSTSCRAPAILPAATSSPARKADNTCWWTRSNSSMPLIRRPSIPITTCSPTRGRRSSTAGSEAVPSRTTMATTIHPFRKCLNRPIRTTTQASRPSRSSTSARRRSI